LVAQLPLVVQHWLTSLEGVSAELSGSFRAESRNQQISWEGKGRVTRGRLQTAKIAFPLEDLSADLFCKNSLLQVRNGNARSGDADIRVAMDWQGMTKQSPLTCLAEVDNLELNQRLFQSLPPDIQETWKKMRATGRVDAQANIHYNGATWIPHVIVQAKDVSVHPDIFPYPTHNITGKFEYRDGVITTTDLGSLIICRWTSSTRRTITQSAHASRRRTRGIAELYSFPPSDRNSASQERSISEDGG